MKPAAADKAHQREQRRLGYAGLLPVAGCLVVMLSAEDSMLLTAAAQVLIGYAAVIASFLGAVHWGVAATDSDGKREARLRWGVMPALLAWPLGMLPAAPSLIGFALLFALILYVDLRLLPILDSGYRSLRLRLSLFLVSGLTAAALLTTYAGEL